MELGGARVIAGIFYETGEAGCLGMESLAFF